MPASDLSLLLNAAETAADIALKYFGRDPTVWEKDANAGPVTEADIAVNDMLSDTLRDARPDYGWLSEETTDGTQRLTRDRVFVIDPIDGTRAFIEGSRDWAIALAVIEGGMPTAAAIIMPARDVIYAASLGGGVTRNGAPIRVSDQSDLTTATVLTAKPNLAAHHWQGGAPPAFNKAFRSSLAYRLALVAEGRFDAMLTLRPSWEWDIAAGALMVAEAGGTISDKTNAPLRFNNPAPQLNGVVAGNGVHETITAALI